MPAEALDEMFATTLSDEYESDESWEAVSALQRLGGRAVFERASAWCSSQDAKKRARGADILAQIGKTAEHPGNSFPDESFAVVSGMLTRETEPLPLASAIYALGHIGDPRAVSILVEYQSHPDANVRFAVATALGHFADGPLAAQVLIRLTADTDADVRDWATFGLGVLGQQDSAEIRDALAARLNDACDDAREEAMIGLAKRRDQRVLAPLISSLESALVPDRAIEAAFEMLGLQNEHGEGWAGTAYAAALRTKFGG
jgi:HEAT repeat protein